MSSPVLVLAYTQPTRPKLERTKVAVSCFPPLTALGGAADTVRLEGLKYTPFFL